MGRETGARQLRMLSVGAAVSVRHRLVAASTAIPYRFALGGYPVLDDRRPPPGLDESTSAVRTAVGIADGGRRRIASRWTGRPSTAAG